MSEKSDFRGPATPDGLPVWIRLPKSGEQCPYTGLSRSALNELILPSQLQPKPSVASISLKKPHEVRGVRLILQKSLLAVLDEKLDENDHTSD